MENRAVVLDTTTTTNAQLENQMVCSLMSIADCKHDEMRRFQAMQIWVEQYPRLKFTGDSLPVYLDDLISRAKNYHPKIKFGSATIVKVDRHFYLKPFTAMIPVQLDFDRTDHELTCLNSSQLLVECHFNRDTNGSVVSFERFIFSFLLPKGSSPSKLNFVFDKSNNQKGLISNQTFVA